MAGECCRALTGVNASAPKVQYRAASGLSIVRREITTLWRTIFRSCGFGDPLPACSGSLPLLCTAQPAPTEPVLTEEQRARLIDRLTELLDEEGRRIGDFTAGGAGFRIADTDFGTPNFSAWAYVRYLNQKSLEETYTDSFGRTKTLDLRNDLQLNKVNLYFKGWIYDPQSVCSSFGRKTRRWATTRKIVARRRPRL